MATTAESNSQGTAPQSRAEAIVRIRFRRRRFFALAMFAVLLVVQEGCLRLEFPFPEVVGFNRVRYQTFARGDARTGPLLKRGLVYDRLIMQSEPDGFYEVHRLNLYGFRGSDFAIAPARDRRRVLVIGDSIAEGFRRAGNGNDLRRACAAVRGRRCSRRSHQPWCGGCPVSSIGSARPRRDCIAQADRRRLCPLLQRLPGAAVPRGVGPARSNLSP